MCTPGGVKRPLHVGDRVEFVEHGRTTYQGVVIAVRPDTVWVRWDDLVVGQFEWRHAGRLKVEAA